MSMTFTKAFATALACFLYTTPTAALWRLQCDGVSGDARIDPLISPGVPSTHLHAIHGGSAFSFNSSADDLLGSSCTSCQVTKDKSAYWSAALYFQDSMGQLTMVPEVSHLTYYKYTPVTVNGKYTFPSAMPNGFKMISGDPYQRNFTLPVPDPPLPWSGADATQAALRQKAIGFNCLNYQRAPEPSLYRHFLPDKSYIDANCADGLRLELLFPQCWDGTNLESKDFKSHVAFPDASINGGTCPDGYGSVINQLFFETIVDTSKFAGQAGQFVLSDGDPTGFAYHGDVIIAWEDDFLDQATKTCGPDLSPSDPGFSGQTTDCPVFQPVLNDQQAMQTCSIATPAALKMDVLAGLATQLPGGVPIQSGPAYAKPDGSGAPAATPTPPPSGSSSGLAKPSLSYTAGSSGTAPEEGNVFLQTAASTSSAASSSSAVVPPPAPTSTSAAANIAAAPSSSALPAAPASSSSPVPPPSAPATTAAPAAAPAAGPVGLQLTTVTTSYYTRGRDAYEVVVVAEEVTVTVDGNAAAATPAVGRKRHEHAAHARRHAHHWRGGRI